MIHLEREDGTLRQQKLGIKFRGMRADQILTSEAFDLGTTRDSETDDMLTEYRRLMRKGDVSDISSARLAELRDQLRDTLPRPHETAISREAADLIGRMSHARIVEQLAEVPPERRSAVTREMQEYLQRLSDERGLS
ncbi:MAG TPA: hypothetical protein VFY36_10300 [Solirubrobacteraceae bacterium]|nr:hypothetical protein [Solirubrobacteraceae bacterium]